MRFSLKKKEFNAYAEDDEDMNEQEMDVLADAEQEAIYSVLKEKEEEVNVLSEKYKKKVREFIRILTESQKLQTILQNSMPVDSNDSNPEENILKSCYDIIVSMKFVFLKKLSTGFDEQETHKNLMERLKSNIGDNTKMLKIREDELKEIIDERTKSNANKNEEIKKCKNDLIEMKEQQEEKSKALDEENVRKRLKTKSMHEERETKLKEAISKAVKNLQEQEKRNSEEENSLTKIVDDLRTRLSNFTQEYDAQIKDKKVLLSETQVP